MKDIMAMINLLGVWHCFVDAEELRAQHLKDKLILFMQKY